MNPVWVTILGIEIAAATAVVIWFLKNAIKEYSSAIFELKRIQKYLHVSNATSRDISEKLGKFNGDFIVRFDDDLVRKLNAIFNLGQSIDGVMVKKTEDGKTEVVKIDEGW